MVLALIVLLGFGGLFMFAFDEGMQGGEVTIESEIRSQAKELESLKSRITTGQQEMAVVPDRVRDADNLSRTKRTVATLEKTAQNLESEIEAGKEAITAKQQEWESYKDAYRAFVRDKAKGEELAELELRDGQVFKDVDIREVTAIGMQIRYEGGHKRISFEEMTDKMQDYYQYDAAQKVAAMAEEQARTAKHNMAAAAATEVQSDQLAQQRAQDAAEAKVKIQAQISEKEAQVLAAQDDIKGFEQDKVTAQAAADAARKSGRMHLNKSGNIDSKIRRKQNFIASLQAEIRSLKSRL